MSDPQTEPQPDEGEDTPETEPETPTPDEGDEAEEAEHEEGGETAAEEPPPQSSFTVSETLNRKLETERKRHAKAIEKLADAYDQDTAPCPICERPELAQLVVASIQAMPEDFWRSGAALGGLDLEAPHREAEGVHMCDRCDGWGELDYPTRNPHMARQTCPRCAGSGYLSDDVPEQPAAVVNIPGYTPASAAPPPVTFAGTDQWGRPAGHPHWGQDPAAVGA